MSLPTPFQPVGATFAANATTSSGAISMSWTQPAAYFNITNTASVPVFYRLSTNTISSVAIPSAGSSAPGQMINAGDTYIVALPVADGSGVSGFVSNVTISAMTQSGTSQLFINPVQPF